MLADFRELIFLERAARRACFVPIPRTTSQLVESDAKPGGASAVEFKEVPSLLPGSRTWDNKCVNLAPVSASEYRSHSAASRSVTLVIDQRLSMHFGSRSKAKSVVAAEIAAFIAWRAHGQDARVGALIFNDKKLDWLWPNSSRLSVMLILHAVVNQNHALSHNGKTSFNPEMLNRALRRIERSSGNDSAIFLITDGGGYNEETRRLVSSISQRSHLHLVLIFDPRQKKFSKTRWLLSNRITQNVRSQAIFDKSWLSSSPGRGSQILNRPFLPGTIPIIRFSTWESVTEQLRRAARKTILPPQIRPAQPARHYLNGDNITHNDFDTPETKQQAIPLDGSALTNTQKFRPQAL
jgi:hypothetical protein